MKRQLIAFLLVAFAMSGCGPDRAENENGRWHGVLKTSEYAQGRDAIAGRQWKLIELEGSRSARSGGPLPGIHFFLKGNSNRLVGFTGCNTFSGRYELIPRQRIRFRSMVKSTGICSQVDFDEQQLFDALQLTDNYTIDGDTLYLRFGRRAPLAVFSAEPVGMPADAGDYLAEESRQVKAKK